MAPAASAGSAKPLQRFLARGIGHPPGLGLAPPAPLPEPGHGMPVAPSTTQQPA